MLLRISPETLTDPAPIEWLTGRLEFGGTVGAWIPGGFDRYARLLHPVIVWPMEIGRTDGRLVRWRDLSAWSGKPLHRASWAEDLLTRSDGAAWSPPDARPVDAQLPEPDFGRLAGLLAEATGTPDALWLLLWDGHVGTPDLAMEVSPSLTGSGRTYLLHQGRFEPGDNEQIGPSFREPPSFWWPEDHAWFVSTDVDIWSTYVGGSEGLIEGLLADDGLEGWPAELGDPIDGSPYW